MSGNQVTPEQGMLDSDQRNAGIKIPCLTTWRMPYIYCHMNAMASIWPNITAIPRSLVLTVTFLFNAVFSIPNAINVSHTVVAIFNTNMIYTSKSNYLYFLSISARLYTQELKTLLKQSLSIGQKRVSHKTYRITSAIQKCL